MLVAHVTDPEVDGRTVSRGGLHHLGHHPGYVDPWFVDLLFYLPMYGRASFALGRGSLGPPGDGHPLVDLTAFAVFPTAV